jgi:hypothetical protein
MSISATDRTKIARYTGADPVSLDSHIQALEADGLITAERELAIGTLLTTWSTNNLDTSFVRIDAGPSGFKGRVDSQDLRDAIINDLVNLLLLHRTTWYRKPSIYTVQLERG